MGRSRKERPDDLMDMTQVVGWRMSAARKSQGRTQEWVAERMTLFTGVNWTISTVSLAENSATSSRPRSFTANDIVALARTFGLPIPYFFIPPDDPPMEPNFPGAPDAGWSCLVGLLVGSSDARKQLGVLLGKDWILKPIPIPLDDLIDDSGDRALGVPKELQVSGTSLLAAAFYGLIVKQLGVGRGEELGVGDMAAVLESMSLALWKMDGYNLERSVNPQLAAEIEPGRSKDVETDR